MENRPGETEDTAGLLGNRAAVGSPRALMCARLRREGRRLFYNRDGRQTQIRRVYNRLIPDDVERLKLDLPFDYRDDLDVEWTGGPDWYFRVSKFSMPFLRHPWVPRTVFLHEVARLPG
jgi:hypothetical protein